MPESPATPPTVDSAAPPTRRTSALGNLIGARLKEFYRQPEAVFWVYFFPLLMVVALGVAFRNKPIEEINVDLLQSPEVSSLMQALHHDPRIKAQTLPLEQCQQRLRTGKSDLYIVSEGPSALKYFFDPTRPGSVVARDTVDDLLQTARDRIDPIETSVEEVNEPGGRYIDFLIPGLIGMGLMGGGLWGVGFAIVDMRIRKLLKRFLATPMSKAQFLMAIMISRLLFMVPEMVLLVVFARFVFDVRVFGSWLAVVFLVLLGAIQFSGVGLLVASRAKTLESVSGLMNLTMLPMWTLSGIFFSYERFPVAVQPFIQALPLTPLIDALRAVMLEGASLLSLWVELTIITVWSVVAFVLALWWFRWHD